LCSYYYNIADAAINMVLFGILMRRYARFDLRQSHLDWVNCCPRSRLEPIASAAADVMANVVLGPRYNNTAVVGRQQSALAVCFITLMLGYTIFNVCGSRMITDYSVRAAWLALSTM
jgi:hypothetical protein